MLSPNNHHDDVGIMYYRTINQAVPILVVVVVLTLTRIIKFVVTGQAPVTVELRNTPREKHKPKVVHAYVTADAILASTRNI